MPVARTIADGQQLDMPGERTFAVDPRARRRRRHRRDAEIVAAMRFAFERLKLVLEPSGASALAALLAGPRRRAAARAWAWSSSGGNVDAARFRALTA